MTDADGLADRGGSLGIHPLLAPLLPEQQLLVDTIGAVFTSRSGRWPYRLYVEHELARRGHSLDEVLNTLPTIRGASSSPTSNGYRAVWIEGFHLADDGIMGLTLAGLAHLAPANEYPQRWYLGLLGGIVEYFFGGSLDPFTVEQREISLAAVAQHIGFRDNGWLSRMPEVFAHEPPTIGGDAGLRDDGQYWRYSVAMRHFRGVRDITDYLTRLAAYMAPPVATPTLAPHQPPLALAASLDFLDAVWKLKYNAHILRLPGAYPVSTLAEEASTPEEFDARLSALGQVIGGLSIKRGPGISGRSLEKLRARLRLDLSEESQPRVAAAIATIQASVTVRDAAQHTPAAPNTIEALRVLGLPYPVTDWAEAWSIVRSRVTVAVDDIREELLALLRADEDAEGPHTH